MRLVLLGPPGAGKGTQADMLSKEYNIPHISTGDILREAVREESEIGKKAKKFMDKGDLVPDSIVTETVAQGLAKPDTGNGFILDGYPRTKAQAENLSAALESKGISIDYVLYFKTSVPTIIFRLSGRRICSKCGAIYHIKNNPPSKKGICGKCGSRLYQREDDKEATIKKRLEVYQKTEKGLLDYYREMDILREVPGDSEAEKLFRSLKALFERRASKWSRSNRRTSST